MKKKGSKKAAIKTTQYKIRVIYGFRHKLKVVLLGDVLSGKVDEGMTARFKIKDMQMGEWPVMELLKMDFINNEENPNFIGLMLRCANEEDYNLLKSLRVYEEVIELV